MCRAFVAMSIDSLLPDLPRPLCQYEVTVSVPRGDGDEDEVLLPPGGRAVVELAAAAVAADGWTGQAVVSMLVDVPSECGALAAGMAVARVLDTGNGAVSVTADSVRPGGTR